MTLNVGAVLNNRYRIARLVGQGGFGAVYRAWDTSLSQPVALKENSGGGAEAQRQFEREAQLLAGLRHPNLPRVIDHFIVPGQGQYLVMDFVEGKSLSERLIECGGPLSEAEVLPWIRQVADALEYLHTRTPPVIHRDIKPDNIIITQEGRAILVDFGISKVYEASKSTTVGAKAVTPGYSPPEQYGRGRTDARSDVYALGATLYTLLTGQVPPDGPDLASGADMLTPPRQANPAVSETVSGTIQAAMTPSISQRLPSAGAFVTALTTGMPAAPGVLRQQVANLSPTQRRLPSLPAALGLLVLVGLLALGGWLLSRRDDGRETAAATLPPATQPVAAAATTETTPIPPPTQTSLPEPTAAPTDLPADTPVPTPLTQVFDSRSLPLPGGLSVEQLYVPGGSFMMGSASSEADERPIHSVTLDAFWIDRTEVTNRQFAAFVADTGHQTLAELQGSGHGFTTNGWGPMEGAFWQQPQGPGFGLEAQNDHPVVQVSWDDAVAYCAWASGRLPTEAEWEYAARGPDARTFPWGDGFDHTRLNYCDRNCFLEWADSQADDGFVLTAPVGSFPDGASWIGALDMAGNVWEWTADWYGPEYYEVAPAADPTGPESGVQRVVRGGGWDDTFDFARSAKRHVYAPDRPQNYLGFRCVATAADSASPASSTGIVAMPVSGVTNRNPAPILLVDPAGCDQPGSFRDTATIPFQWRYETSLSPGEYMEVRVEPNPGTASQGKVTSSTNGLWRQAVSVTNFDVGAGSYRWMVVHMGADGRSELATSDLGCFAIWSDN